MKFLTRIREFFERRRCRLNKHDYQDGIDGYPWHLYEHTCKRCGKKFFI